MKSRDENGGLPAVSESADSMAERRLSRALEAVPHIDIAPGFAERVMREIPELSWRDRVLQVESASVGRKVARGALLVLAAIMLAMVPLGRGTGYLALTVECLLCLQFIGLTLWMSLGTQRQR